MSVTSTGQEADASRLPAALGDSGPGKSWLPPEARALREGFPPRTTGETWDVTCLDRDAVVARSLVPPFALDNPASRRQRRTLLMHFLDWLQAQPGGTWQDRWNASGVDTGGRAAPGWKDIPAAWLAAAGRSH
jgi:hypothetical protein